ncbi:MAG: YihY/virulence factor BrkB family protein [Pirellulales bacterium]|nr:YihY/virulence factor BrkB family protein [Pirellulales bacterium]
MASVRGIFSQFIDSIGMFFKNDGMLLASSIAYSLALSLFPLMLVLVAVLGWAFRFTSAGVSAEQRVLAAIEEQASPELKEQVALSLDSVESSAGTGGVVGAVTLLAAAIAIFSQIDYAFDRIWENSAEAGVGWKTRVWNLAFRRLKAFGMLMGVAAFVIAVMIASIVWHGLQANLANVMQAPPWINRVAQPALQVALNAVAFALVYRYLPKASVRWSAALAGGSLTSVLWEVGRQVLAAYVVGDKLPTAYGVIGSFMAIMLWTYYAMIIVLFGATYSRVLNEGLRTPSTRHP